MEKPGKANTAAHNEILAKAQVSMNKIMELLTKYSHFIFRKHLPSNAFLTSATEDMDVGASGNVSAGKRQVHSGLSRKAQILEKDAGCADCSSPAQAQKNITLTVKHNANASEQALFHTRIQALDKRDSTNAHGSPLPNNSEILASIRGFETQGLKCTQKPLISQDSGLLASVRGFEKEGLKRAPTLPPPQDNGLLASIRGFEKQDLKCTQKPPVSQNSGLLASIRGFEKQGLRHTQKPPSVSQNGGLLASIHGFEKQNLKCTQKPPVSQNSGLLASVRDFEKQGLRHTQKPPSVSQNGGLLASIRGFEKQGLKHTQKPPSVSQNDGLLANIRGFEKRDLKHTQKPPVSQATGLLASIRGFEKQGLKQTQKPMRIQEVKELGLEASGTSVNSQLKRACMDSGSDENKNILLGIKLQAKVLYSFDPQEDGELALSTGATITVLERSDDGWWRGCLPNGSSGLFPGNHVTLVA